MNFLCVDCLCVKDNTVFGTGKSTPNPRSKTFNSHSATFQHFFCGQFFFDIFVVVFIFVVVVVVVVVVFNLVKRLVGRHIIKY